MEDTDTSTISVEMLSTQLCLTDSELLHTSTHPGCCWVKEQIKRRTAVRCSFTCTKLSMKAANLTPLASNATNSAHKQIKALQKGCLSWSYVNSFFVWQVKGNFNTESHSSICKHKHSPCEFAQVFSSPAQLKQRKQDLEGVLQRSRLGKWCDDRERKDVRVSWSVCMSNNGQWAQCDSLHFVFPPLRASDGCFDPTQDSTCFHFPATNPH